MNPSDQAGSCATPKLGRLAIVVPSAYPLGGVQSWLDYLIPGLDALGWSVTVLLVHGVHGDAMAYLRQHPFPNVRLVVNPTGSREGRVGALSKLIRALEPDLVLSVNIADSYEAVSRLRSAKGGPKLVMALHGLQSCYFHDMAQWADLLDGVVATNRLAALAATDLAGIAPDRVHYAPCGATIAKLETPGDSPDRANLFFAGRFDAQEKRVLDLPLILDALDRRGTDFHLRLAGAGPAEPDLRRALERFGDRVEFLGVLDEAALRSGFSQPGTIALVMSPAETGPMVAWEAMACGAVLVCSRFVGIGVENSLRDAQTCLSFPVGDIEAAASAIARLSDPALRSRLAAAGQQMVRERYSRNASISAWSEALQKLNGQDRRALSPPPQASPVAGRLDRLLGPGLAERLRRLLGLRFRHAEPGGEWPHSYSNREDPDFFQNLATLDAAAQDKGPEQ